ncbi:toll/interleukin-1 receptor domain-containing protein [Helicobacter pylori]|uniref:toll/interleukin-1 receptor domain-containing protein n=1 Tax=Helicobacter pylori TaxID=210 RepID=UPI000EAC9938|nr:toll/interleukin-1 receptor domain-containing protein [Helicobacter pylori]
MSKNIKKNIKAFKVDLDSRENQSILKPSTRYSNNQVHTRPSNNQVHQINEAAKKIDKLIKNAPYSNDDIILKRNEIKEAFFSPFKPQLKNAQVFLSHSHADRNKALKVKGYLEEDLDAECVFIDSLFWDYKDDVLNKLAEYAEYDDNDISVIEDAFTLILRESLQDMIEKCPYFVFLQSKNSVSNKGLSRITYSAWIYEELKIANTFITGTTLKESRIKAMRVSYDVTNLLRRFKYISLDSLCKKIAPNLITKDTK